MRPKKPGSRRPRGRPPTGAALTPAERMRRLRERRRAAGYKSVVAWVPAPAASPVYSSHRRLDARSLAMHVVIAQKIERDPRLLEIARRNLQQWSARWRVGAPRWVEEWRRILAQPWPAVAALITEPSERATRLRQSSPFAGILSVAERRRIYEAFRA